MHDTNDQALICEYANRNSESAFAGLVQRHIHLVYSVAVRYVGNTADAQDVTQAVFVILAGKAAGLRQRTTLTGWLYETTRLTAAALLKRRARQQVREHEAYMQSTLNDSEPGGAWQQLAPILEEAMGRLNEKERTLLALRLYDNKTAAECAALLGIETNAAHKRTARALEKLRRFFLRRGIRSSTALIAATISANSVQAAPAALTQSVITAAMVHCATANTSTLTLIKGALKIMAWSKTKATIVTSAVLLLTAGAGTVVVKHIEMQKHKSQLRSQLARGSMPILKISPNGTVSVIQFPKNGTGSGRSSGHGAAFSFKSGLSHEALLRQLDQMHAVILSDTPELLRAETTTAEMDFKFTDGTMKQVTMIPKAHGTNSIANVQR